MVITKIMNVIICSTDCRLRHDWGHRYAAGAVAYLDLGKQLDFVDGISKQWTTVFKKELQVFNGHQ